MPSLLPRKITQTASVIRVCDGGLPHTSTGSASPILINEATCRFTCVTACCFANWELTTLCYQNAAPLNYRGESDNSPDGTLTRVTFNCYCVRTFVSYVSPSSPTFSSLSDFTLDRFSTHREINFPTMKYATPWRIIMTPQARTYSVCSGREMSVVRETARIHT